MEAAGYDVVLVETVGVGQSETAVANMVDSFLLLTLARTGDQLQGIKKGVLELADVVAVNKADGPHERDARAAARELAGALRLMHGADAFWTPPVLSCSARESSGLDDVWGRLSGTARCSTRPAASPPSARTSRSTGPGPWSARSSSTGCARTRRSRNSHRSWSAGSGTAS